MPETDNSLMLTILKELRADMRQQRTLLLQLTEAAHRHDRRFGDIERRISDMRAGIELMLKAELLGRSRISRRKWTSGSRNSKIGLRPLNAPAADGGVTARRGPVAATRPPS